MSPLVYSLCPSPIAGLGYLLLAASDKGLRHLWLGDAEEELVAQLRKLAPDAREDPTQLAPFTDTIRHWLLHPQSPLTVPLDPTGTAFQLEVWQTLQTLPCGTTVTYSQLAQMLNRPQAVRAVASACARNSLALVIPCHRVVGKSGTLAGYRWSLARKAALLAHETQILKH